MVDIFIRIRLNEYMNSFNLFDVQIVLSFPLRITLNWLPILSKLKNGYKISQTYTEVEGIEHIPSCTHHPALMIIN